MEKFTQKVFTSLLFCLLLFFGQRSYAQVIFTSTPDTIAILNELYSYDVEATFAPDAPTYSLETAPGWMTINASTGVITGTPTSVSMGGKVIVNANNSHGDYKQTFYVYISDAIVCDPTIVAYWPMDNKVGTSLPDNVNAHNARWVGTTEPVPTISSEAMVGNSLLFAPDIEDDEFYGVADQEPFDFFYQDDFSVSLWFKNQDALVNPLRNEVMIGRGEAGAAMWSISWSYVNERVEFHLQDGSTDDTTIISLPIVNDNEWHHVVATFDGKHVAAPWEDESILGLYVDKNARVVYRDYYTENFHMDDAEVTIGWDAVYNEPFSGYLDEVVFYDKALSSSEITELYNKGIAHQSICQPGNIAPIIASTAITTATEDVAYSYTFLYRNPDGGSVTLSAPVLPTWLTFNATSGVLSGTPTNDNVGSSNVTLRLTKGTLVLEQTFVIAVANVNDLPEISTTPATSVDEDVAYTYTIVASDVDAGATLTYSAPVLPSWMNFNTTTHVLSGTPTNDQVGMDASKDYDVTLRVTDNTTAVTDQTFTITVNQVNDDPEVTSQNTVATDEDIAIAVTLANLNVTDVDNTFPDDFALTVKNGTNYTHTGNTITPAENFNGTLTVPVDISDGTAVISYNMSVTVNAVNDAPVFTSTAITAGATGTAYEYWITTSDVENLTRTLTCPTKPAWLNFTTNAGNGLLSGTPSNPGAYNVTLTISDGVTAVDQSFIINVTGTSAIGDPEAELAKVFPNPASDFVDFTFESEIKSGDLRLFGINGQLVKQVSINNQKSYRLDVSSLSGNEYLYIITSDKGEQRGKLLIK